MKKLTIKTIDSVISKVVKTNVNSTSSFTAFQPELPKAIKDSLKDR